MAFDVRLIAEDPRTGRLYRTVGDDDGRLAFIEIAPDEVRKCDQKFKLPEGGGMVGLAYGKEVPYPAGQHPVISEADVNTVPGPR